MHVCPTGVDIRGGPDLGCIQCGLCIDACDAVMKKIGRPPRLIAYDTDINIKRREQGLQPLYKIMRTRTVLYAAIIGIVGMVMSYAFATRMNDAISVLHDRNPLFVRLSDGSLRNAYTLRILNKSLEKKTFAHSRLRPDRCRHRRDRRSGFANGNPLMDVGPDQSREVRVLVTDARAAARESLDPDRVQHPAEDRRHGRKRGRSFLRTIEAGACRSISSVMTNDGRRGGPRRANGRAGWCSPSCSPSSASSSA